MSARRQPLGPRLDIPALSVRKHNRALRPQSAVVTETRPDVDHPFQGFAHRGAMPDGATVN